MKVIPNGAKVKVGDHIDGIVLASMIEGLENHLSYKIAIWNGNQRHVEWFQANEVVSTGDERRTIGFSLEAKQ
jgi:hypothetical protein